MQNYSLSNIYEWPISIRGLLLGLIFVVVLYMGYYFDISKQMLQMASIKQQEENLKQQILFQINAKVEMANDIAKLPLITKTLLTWQDKLITPKELPELLNQILKMGAIDQLQFDFFNPGTEKKTDLYSILPIKVVVTGSYHQIADFISQIANMPKIVLISELTIESKETSVTAQQNPVTPGVNLTATLMLEVYHLVKK